MGDLVNYRCTRCGHDFQEYAGPTECPNCQFMYVKNMDAAIVYEEIKTEADDAFVPCMDDSCVI